MAYAPDMQNVFSTQKEVGHQTEWELSNCNLKFAYVRNICFDKILKIEMLI